MKLYNIVSCYFSTLQIFIASVYQLFRCLLKGYKRATYNLLHCEDMIVSMHFEEVEHFELKY